jgi:hypothetical protein
MNIQNQNRFISYITKDDSSVKYGYFTESEWNSMKRKGYKEVNLLTNITNENFNSENYEHDE